jgi:hypothetical protein
VTAAICAGLILITRIQGIVVWGIAVFTYLVMKKWDFRKIDRNFIWLILSPVGLVLHLFHLYKITGYVLAPYQAQAAWGRSDSGFLTNIGLNLNSAYLDVFKIDFLLVIFFIFASIYILLKWPNKSYGLLAVSLCVLPLISGSLISIGRFLLVVFPVFILMGERIKRPDLYDAVRTILFTLQIIYFSGWVNYYWIA